MSLRFFVARLAGTLISNILRILPYSGGGAAPGLLALTLDPDFVKHQAPHFTSHLVVSGTNGKTTTTRMISTIFQAAQLPHIHNRSGSNLLRGIASTLLLKSSESGWRAQGTSGAATAIPVDTGRGRTTGEAPDRTQDKTGKPLGLWEVDEAALPEVLAQLKPQLLVLTNLFRDQLDRYGEIDTLAQKWLAALKTLPKTTTVLLNGDDATLVELGSRLKHQIVLFYGISDRWVGTVQPAHAADATFCPRCLKPLRYSQVFYSHLGIFSCSCGFTQPNQVLTAKQIKQTPQITRFTTRYGAETHRFTLPLSGLFNVYNALAAVAVSRHLGISWTVLSQALTHFRPAFGRMESIRSHGKTLHLMLVKNPTGFNQVITTITARSRLPLVVLALNDKLADGTDVSWIWDVELEQLVDKAEQVIVTGTRAYDLAVRLKYAGFGQKTIQVIPNLKQSLGIVLGAKEKQVYLLPTYTAMLTLRHLLTQHGIIHASWED